MVWYVYRWTQNKFHPFDGWAVSWSHSRTWTRAEESNSSYFLRHDGLRTKNSRKFQTSKFVVQEVDWSRFVVDQQIQFCKIAERKGLSFVLTHPLYIVSRKCFNKVCPIWYCYNNTDTHSQPQPWPMFKKSQYSIETLLLYSTIINLSYKFLNIKFNFISFLDLLMRIISNN